VTILVREEDIASPFEDLQHNDLFFFFGFFSLKVQDILSAVSPPSSSQALTHTKHPGKKLVNKVACEQVLRCDMSNQHET